MAQQIVNTVILRPEIEMCYVGVLNKCFELLEDSASETSEDLSDSDTAHVAPGVHGSSGAPVVAAAVAAAAAAAVVDSGDEDSDGGDEDDEEEEDGEEDEEEDGDETDTDADGGGEKDLSEDEEWGKEKCGRVRVRLREILFYDDKVAVFRARSGKL